MNVLFTLLRVYPIWALPLALALGELGRAFRRKGLKRYQNLSWIWGFVFVLTTGVWVGFRGDLHSDEWMRRVQALFTFN